MIGVECDGAKHIVTHRDCLHIMHIHKHNSSGCVVCPTTSWKSTTVHGLKKKKNSLEGLVLSITASHTRHTRSHSPHYPILHPTICRDQLHCMATKQPSNTTSILPSSQYRSIHSTPPIPALCVSP